VWEPFIGLTRGKGIDKRGTGKNLEETKKDRRLGADESVAHTREKCSEKRKMFWGKEKKTTTEAGLEVMLPRGGMGGELKG